MAQLLRVGLILIIGAALVATSACGGGRPTTPDQTAPGQWEEANWDAATWAP